MRAIPVGAVGILALGLACSGSGVDEGPGGGGTANLVAVQALRSAATVQVMVGGHSVLTLSPGIASATVTIPAGTSSLQLQPTGGSAAGSTRTVTFAAGQRYLLVAAESSGVAVPTLLADTNATPVAGKSKLRVIHAAGLAPPIDIWRTQPDFPTLIRVMFPFDFNAVSPFLLSDPGDWSIVVTPEGQPDTLYATGSFSVGGGKLVTVVVMDSTAAGGISAVVVPDN
jgi:hypothetical protein